MHEAVLTSALFSIAMPLTWQRYQPDDQLAQPRPKQCSADYLPLLLLLLLSPQTRA